MLTWGDRRRDSFASHLVFLTVLLGIASSSLFLGRWHWFADLFSHFAFHYALAALVLAGGLAWAGRNRWAALATAIFAVHILQLLPYWLTPPETHRGGTDTDEVGILQFNVNSIHQNPAEILAWLETRLAELDVIVLMEVTRAWEEPLVRLQQAYPFHVMDLREDFLGIAVFSRLPTDSVRIDRFGLSDLLTVVLHATTYREKMPFVLYATHTQAPVGREHSHARNRQLAGLGVAIAGEPQTHRILLGDLNVTPWSYWFWELARTARLRDAQEGFGYRGTWVPWWIPTWVPQWIPDWVGIPIDHTLVSESIRVKRRESGPRLGSDHRPVITTLSFPARSGAGDTRFE